MDAISYQQQLLANAAVEPDGVELDFQGDRCGKSYYLKRNCIKTWESFFYDWREGGWVELRGYGSATTHKRAIETCNQHAVENRLIKFLPHKMKFRPTPFGWGGIAAAASQAAAVAGFSL